MPLATVGGYAAAGGDSDAGSAPEPDSAGDSDYEVPPAPAGHCGWEAHTRWPSLSRAALSLARFLYLSMCVCLLSMCVCLVCVRVCVLCLLVRLSHWRPKWPCTDRCCSFPLSPLYSLAHYVQWPVSLAYKGYWIQASARHGVYRGRPITNQGHPVATRAIPGCNHEHALAASWCRGVGHFLTSQSSASVSVLECGDSAQDPCGS